MNKSNDALPKGVQELGFRIQELDYLSEDDREIIIRKCQFLKLARNTTLFEEGDKASHFYILLSGAVKLIKKSEEEVTLIDLVAPSEIIAGALMVNQNLGQYPVTARAMCQTELIKISRILFQECWHVNSSFFQYLMQQISIRMQRMQNEKKMQRWSLDQKLAYFLTERIANNPELRITRQDLADAFGASNESVIRVLSQWTKQNLISTQHQVIKIHDLDQLKSIWKIA